MLEKIKKVKLGEIIQTQTVFWDKTHIGLKESIVNNYNIKNGIVVSKNMKIIDGHHRYLIFVEHYGLDFEIEVKQIQFDFIWIKMFGFVFLPLVLLSICIIIPIIIIPRGIKLLINFIVKK
jgi:hypothetical protein